MKKFGQFRYLVLFAITISGTAAAETFSQKTVFTPRAIGTNRAMEYTTWQEFAYGKVTAPSKAKINSHVALTAFYQESQKGADMGKYFGIGNGKNSFNVGPLTAVPGDPVAEVINNFLIHDLTDADNSTNKGTISFKPSQKTYGARLDYFQDINDPVKGFFFKASLPVVLVQNDMGMKNDGNEELTKFFKGTYTQVGDNAQTELTKGKIDGRHSVIGLADLNLALGYKLHSSAKKHAFFNVGVIIPTGTKPNGEYLFGPIVGNGGHVGFTTGLDGGVTLWTGKEEKASVRLLAALDYRYLFEAGESRTPSLNKSFFGAEKGTLNHYYLGGYLGKKESFPAANIFTRLLKVKPGSQGEALVDLSFKCSGFVIDLGYNAFYKEKESAWLKGWNDDSFGIVKRSYDMTNQLDVKNADTFVNDRTVKSTDFDIESIINPAQFSHKVFGGLGYSFTVSKEYLANLGLGASYEFASDNATMEAMALWIKSGISF